MELCGWYEVEELEGMTMSVCRLTKENTNCRGDVHDCECPLMRKDEMRAEMIGWKMESDREEGAGWRR